MFAGDKRVEGVLSFADQGNYNAEDLHPGMKYFIDCLQGYMLSEIDRKEAMRGDSIYARLEHKYGRFGDRTSAPQTKYPVWNGIEYVDMPVDNITEEWYEYSSETLGSYILLKTQWGQRWPYNTKIQSAYGADYPTGCVATAVAQTMSYYKIGTYNGKTYLWNRFPTTYWYAESTEVLNSIGDLFFDLGKAENLDMHYNPNGSSASTYNVPRTLNHFGYTSDSPDEYNQSSVINNLINRNPVYMQGTDNSNGGVHAWVVDGLQISEVYTRYRINYWYEGRLQGSEYVKRNIQNSYAVHLNWGWNGSYNCWSVPGVFNTHDIYNFNTDHWMVGGIKPR